MTGPIRTPDQRLRVFISSTLGEVAEERRAARRAVEQLRLTPILFELGARPHPPRALYRSYLAQSDVFVGIYWERYGWVAPDMDISGLEDEFVLSAGMPRLVYVKRPAPNMEPRLADMLERHQAEDQASYKPFADADELHDLLLDDLALLLTERFDSADETPRADPGRSNLPAPTSAFVGREVALRDLDRWLGDPGVRLVTLTGPGGTGKTRLAVEAARAALDRFVDGVWFVDLSVERDPDRVFVLVSRAMGVGRDAEGSVLDGLARDIGDRKVLLVLDNFEQVVAASVGVAELLTRCAALTVLVTSREALRVEAEQVVPVPPLTVPTTDPAVPPLDAVVASEAGRLFLDRVAAAGVSFVPTDANAAVVAAICRRLDGLPLALQLAAARVKVFGLDELRAELDARSEVLAGGGRDLPARQQTLRNTIRWSHDLLEPDERTVFALFSVFPDARLVHVGAVVARVPAVAGVDVVESLSSLVDKSLVRVVEGNDGRPRLDMLQTIREFASEQLDAMGDVAAATRDAHAVHYTELATAIHRGLSAADRAEGLVALGSELRNLRAAWEYWVHRRDIGRLGELLEPVWGYFDARGDYRSAIVVGEELLRVLRAQPDTPERRYDELAVETNLARTNLAVRGFTPEAEQAIQDAVDRFDATGGDVRQRFPALRSLASLRLMRSEFSRMAEVTDDLLEIAESEGDPALLADAHLLAAVRSGWTEDLLRAIDHTDRAIDHFRSATSGFVSFRVGPNPGVVATAVSGVFRWLAGFPDTAAARGQAAVRLARDLDHPPSIAYALHHANVIDLWRRDLGAVRARAEELLALVDEHGYPSWRPPGLVYHGAALAFAGEVEVGLAEVDDGSDLYVKLASPPIFWPAILLIRALAHGSAGRLGLALDLIADAESVVLPEDPLLADVALSHGDLVVAASPEDRETAADHYRRSAAIARLRQARMVEVQAVSRLLPLVGAGPEAAEVRARLEELLGSFTEGFESPQLIAARAALV